MAEGVPLRIELTVVDAATGDALPGAAVYVWHCDREGRYSLYSDGVTRQTTCAASRRPTAVGRWHSPAPSRAPTAAAGPTSTSRSTPASTTPPVAEPHRHLQLALPEDICAVVYEESGYEQSVANLAQSSLETDMVFSDGVDQQLPEMGGDVSSGITAALTIPV